MHKTVLLEESVQGLNLREGDVVIDATLGMGGHTIELAKKVGATGKVIAIDMDKAAILAAQKRVENEDKELLKRIIFVQDNFRNIDKIVVEQGTSATRIKGILADLGWRIEQINDPEYGMSFQVDAKLNMYLGGNSQDVGENAFQIINSWEVEELTKLFKELGEERFSKAIALRIADVRSESEIETTKQLADLIEEVVSRFEKGYQKLHPATRVFQALRIQVNGELNSLNEFLEKSEKILCSGGRLAVISFHSIEDRIVKRFFKSNLGKCICPKEMPMCMCGRKALFKEISSKPILPSSKELESNARSRSAKLRIVEKI